MKSTKAKKATESAAAPAQRKVATKATCAKQGAHIAPAKARGTKKAPTSKEAPTARPKAKGPREGSKTAQVLELLKKPGGATLAELMTYHWLAGAFGARPSLGDRGQEAGPEARLRQGRQRRAQLLHPSLIPFPRSSPAAGFLPGGMFLRATQSQFGGPVRQREAQSLNVRVTRIQQALDRSNLLERASVAVERDPGARRLLPALDDDVGVLGI